ncbi:MAG: ABC-2 family transporter protein [Lachnospiraceae bacterium]|nr:ABC-2 family transporter protein [Lachnospiraceae bacterium]
MKAYFSAFGMRRKMELQYRGAVVGGIICQVFFGLILVAIYRALYAGKPQAMPLSQITSYVWLQQAFFRMLFASDSELLDKIRTGGIAYDLCRPVNLYGFYYARIVAQKLIGSLMRGVPMILFALLLPEGWGLSLPDSAAGLALGLVALVMGLLCISALENITMGFTMRTLDPRGMQALMNMILMTLSGNILPLTLFPDSWQKVIRLLPYAQALDAPIRLYTGDRAVTDAPGLLLIQLCWTLVLVGAGLYFWNKNQKIIVIQGG